MKFTAQQLRLHDQWQTVCLLFYSLC